MMMLIIIVTDCETQLTCENKNLVLTQNLLKKVLMELISYQDRVVQRRNELRNEEKQLDSLKAKVDFGMLRGG